MENHGSHATFSCFDIYVDIIEFLYTLIVNRNTFEFHIARVLFTPSNAITSE